MKKNFKIVSAALLIGLGLYAISGCDKVKDIVKVNVPITMTMPFTIPPVSATDSSATGSSVIEINIDSLIKDGNPKLSADYIKSVTIDSLSLSIDSGSRHLQDNFTALKFIKESFYSDANATKVALASIQNLTDSYTVNIPVGTVPDLSSYFDAGTFYLITECQMKRPTTHAIKAIATVRYMLKVGL